MRILGQLARAVVVVAPLVLYCDVSVASTTKSDPAPHKSSTHKSSSRDSSSKRTEKSTEKSQKQRNDSRNESRQESKQASSDDNAQASLMSPGFDQQTMTRLVFKFTNQERRNQGLSEFHWSDTLAQAAAFHSADMARRDYFSHKSGGFFSRTDVKARIQATGNSDQMMAENIAMLPVWKSATSHLGKDANGNYGTWFEANGETYESLARDTVRMWMESPGHRRNLLNPAYRELGVGVAKGMHQNVPYIYLTQDFGG